MAFRALKCIIGGLKAMTTALKNSLAHWPELSQAVFVPHTETDYQRAVAPLAAEFLDLTECDPKYPASRGNEWRGNFCLEQGTAKSLSTGPTKACGSID